MISYDSIVHRSLKEAGRTRPSWITVWILMNQMCCPRMWLQYTHTHARTRTHTHTPKGPPFRNTEALSLWSLQNHWSSLSEASCHGVAGSRLVQLQGFWNQRGQRRHLHPCLSLLLPPCFLSRKCPFMGILLVKATSIVPVLRMTVKYYAHTNILQLHHCLVERQ